MTTLAFGAQSREGFSANQVPRSDEQNPAIKSLPSVSQLLDVQPTDWAFQSLQSPVQRYECFEGFPFKRFGEIAL